MFSIILRVTKWRDWGENIKWENPSLQDQDYRLGNHSTEVRIEKGVVRTRQVGGHGCLLTVAFQN